MSSPTPSSLASLPPELLCQIFEHVYNGRLPYHPSDSPTTRLQRLLAPTHINSIIRQVLWACPLIWRLIAKNLGSLTLQPKTFALILALCNVQSHGTLDEISFHYQPCLNGPCIQLLQILATCKAQASLRTFFTFPSSEPSYCSCCKLVPSPRAPADMSYYDCLWKFLIEHRNLEALSLNIEVWPRLSILKAWKSLPTPSRLHLGMSESLAISTAGRSACRTLASKAKILGLAFSLNNTEVFGTPASESVDTLYGLVMRSASSTICHLDINLMAEHIDPVHFGRITFPVLETLFVRFINLGNEDDHPEPFEGGTPSSMPSLELIHAPGSFLQLVNAPSVRSAGITIDSYYDAYTMGNKLKTWKKLETLVLYAASERQLHTRPTSSIESALAWLMPRVQRRRLVCPVLTKMAIYEATPTWWQDLSEHSIPRQWDWREPELRSSDTTDSVQQAEPPTIHFGLGSFEYQRRWLASNDLNLSKQDPDRECCRPLEVLRIHGFRLHREVYNQLKEAPAPFKLEIKPVPFIDQADSASESSEDDSTDSDDMGMDSYSD